MKKQNDVVWVVRTTEGISQGYHVKTQGFEPDIIFWESEAEAVERAANSYYEAEAVKMTWAMYNYHNS